MIFVNTRRRVEWLTAALQERGFPVSAIHSELSPSDRSAVMAEFRSGATRVLVATDAIARGIDVQGVSLVINYELPVDREMYIHRIGRSGRCGRSGVAINLISPREVQYLRDIQAFYCTEVKELPGDLSDINAIVKGEA